MNKTNRLLVFLFCLQITVSAQNKTIDSLEYRLLQHQEKDNERVRLLNEIAYKVRNNNINKTLQYATEADSLCNVLKFRKGNAESQLLIGTHYFLKANFPKAKEYFEKSLSIATEINDKPSLSNALGRIGVVYLQQADFPKALEFLGKSIKLSEEINDKLAIAITSNNIGIVYYYQGDYVKTIEYYKKSLSIAEDLHDKTRIASATNNIGSTYEILGDYPKSLEYHQKSLKIREELSDSSGISTSYNNIGNIFLKREENSKALEFYEKALKIREQLGGKSEIALTYSNIGTAYNKMKNNTKALMFYQKSLTIKEEIGEKQGIVIAYYNIANIYSDDKDYAKALVYFKNSLKMATDINSQSYIAVNNVDIGITYYNLNKFNIALDYEKKGYKKAVELGERISIRNATNYLSMIYAALGNYKDAYRYHVEYKSQSDSIANESNTKEIVALEYTYKFEKEKQATELEQQKKDTITTADKQKRTIIMYSFIVGFLLMLILSLVVYRSYLQKQRTNNTLTKQKHEIEDKNEVLQQQKDEILTQAEELKTTNKKLVQLSEFKEGMTGMIVHDLKNPLNSILNNNNLDRIHQAGKQMLNMVMNILDVQKFEDAKMKLELQNTQVFNIVESAYIQVVLLIREKSINFENKIDARLGIKTDPEILERVFVNLLTNAIKYTPNNGRIIIKDELRVWENEPNEQFVIRNSQFAIIKVSDTGQGIPTDKLHLVFEKFGQVQAKNSGGIRSTGLGLTFCKLAVEAHGGQIGVESKTGKGATFWFTVPLGVEIENAISIEKEQPKTETFNFSEEGKKTLLVLLPQFRELEVYEISSIRNLLKNKNISENIHLRFWVEEIQKVLRTGNEERYAELLEMTNTNTLIKISKKEF